MAYGVSKMKRLGIFALILPWALWIAAGCKSRPDTAGREGNSPGQSESAAALDSPSQAPAYQPETPSPRGRGRNMGARAGGRGRASVGPIRLAPMDTENLGIETTRASYRPIRSLHPALGKVLAPQTRMAKVSYAFPGRVAAVPVKIGDWVEKGQPVLVVQSEEVGRAKTEYYKAVADLELAKQNYEREKRLFERGVGAQKNTLSTEAEFKVAQANLEAAEKKLHVLGFSESEVRSIAGSHQINPEITLYAPIGGRIIEQNAVLGEMIDQTSELMTIMDPTVLWVDAEIFERDIAKIRIGQEVRIALPAYPGEEFRGSISYISEVLNTETRTITVRTEVQNRERKLKHGMFADVTIILNGAQKLLTVPADAVLDDSGEKIVFVKTEDEYTPRVVAVSAEQNGYCAISDGLREGEEVVHKGAYMLKSKMYDDLLKKAGVH